MFCFVLFWFFFTFCFNSFYLVPLHALKLSFFSSIFLLGSLNVLHILHGISFLPPHNSTTRHQKKKLLSTHFLNVSSSNGPGGQETSSAITKEASGWREWQPPGRQHWGGGRRSWTGGPGGSSCGWSHFTHEREVTGPRRASEDRSEETAAADQENGLVQAKLSHRECWQHRDLHPWGSDSTLNTAYCGSRLFMCEPPLNISVQHQLIIPCSSATAGILVFWNPHLTDPVVHSRYLFFIVWFIPQSIAYHSAPVVAWRRSTL